MKSLVPGIHVDSDIEEQEISDNEEQVPEIQQVPNLVSKIQQVQGDDVLKVDVGDNELVFKRKVIENHWGYDMEEEQWSEVRSLIFDRMKNLYDEIDAKMMPWGKAFLDACDDDDDDLNLLEITSLFHEDTTSQPFIPNPSASQPFTGDFFSG